MSTQSLLSMLLDHQKLANTLNVSHNSRYIVYSLLLVQACCLDCTPVQIAASLLFTKHTTQEYVQDLLMD